MQLVSTSICILLHSLFLRNSFVASFTTMSDTIKLTYFDIEGVAEAVRLALLLSGTPFEDVRVQFSDWPAMKPTTPNGQLPIMTIGGDDANVKTQSKAMLRWVGMTKSKTLYPTDKVFEIEEIIGILEDLQRAYTPAHAIGMRPANFGYPEGFQSTEEGKKLIESMRTKFVKEELPKYVKCLTDKMEQHGGPFLVAGSGPTVADCVAVPLLRSFTRGIMDHVDPACLNAYPTLITYIKTFCALEPVKGRYDNGVF
jgi:glutathione S-transferase